MNDTEPEVSDRPVGPPGSLLPCVGFAKSKTDGKPREEIELAEFGAELTRHMTAATKVKSPEIESVVIDRGASDNVRLAWSDAPSPDCQTKTKDTIQTDEAPRPSAMGSFEARPGTKVLPANPKIDEYVVQFQPVSQIRDIAESKKHLAAKEQESKPDLKVEKVSYGGLKGSEHLAGRFTYVYKDSRDRKSESLLTVKSPEKKESELGKRLRDYDLESEKSDNEDKRKKTYKDRIKTISAKIIHPCIETIKMVAGHHPSSGSSEDSSSAKTSVVVTEETDLSDENSMCTNSQSEKNVTARKISSGNVTLAEVEFDINKDELKSSEQSIIQKLKILEISCHGDENLAKGAISIADRSQDSSKQKSDKEVKPISDECSEIQTSEDNLSPLEDDENLAVPTPVRKTISPGDITLKENYKASQESSQTSLTSSEEALPCFEENLLTPDSAIKKKSGVKTHKEKKAEELSKTVIRRKSGLTSSEESITMLSKSKSESDTDTKESWIDFRSDSTSASKKGLTSSEEGMTSGKSDTSKKKDDEAKFPEERSSSEMIGSEAINISNRDRIQNLISDTKTVMSSIVTPVASKMVPPNGISKPYPCQVVGKSEKIDEKELLTKKPLPPIEGSESDESEISVETESSYIEIERISERMLPIGGTITLIKGKPPSEQNTTPNWSSASSLLESMVWENRDATENEPSDSSLSSLHKETSVQVLVQMNKDTLQKSTTRDTKVEEVQSLSKDKPSSESDTSSEETQQQKKVLCEQVIKGIASTSKDIFMISHFCIDSIKFGMRRSLSEEKLYSIEADTKAHREKRTSETKVPSAKSSILPDKACDACTFLVLLQTLIIRKRAKHFAFRKMDVCIVNSIGLSRENAHIYRYLLKRMPICELCTFPSVEKMILQLVQSRHGVLMHKAEHIAPIYVIFPSYAENNKTIGRVVHLYKKKVSDYGKKAKIRVMIADRYILFPKLYDSSIWGNTAKGHHTPIKVIPPKIKSRNVPAKMDDIPELSESIVEEPKPKENIEYKTLKPSPVKKRPSKRKVRKCVLKKWSVQTTGTNAQTRRNGSSSDEPISPNVAAGSGTVSADVARTELIASTSKRRRCILKKWTVKMSTKSKRNTIHKCEKQSLSSSESSHLSETVAANEPTEIKTKPTPTTSKASDTLQLLEHKQIDGVILVRKKRPWWKCPTKNTTAKVKPVAELAPKKKPDFYKKFLHPTYQQPLFNYTIESQRTGQLETCLLTRQDLMAQRMAYHYIRELTVGRTESTSQGDEIKVIKPSLTDFQSREYEKRRTFIRDSIQFEPRTSDKIDSKDQESYRAKKSPNKEVSTPQQGSESPLNLGKIDLNQIDYHFENCPIIQKGDTPYRHFLKLQQVNKTTDFKDSWVEYHVEDCSYFMIDGTTVTDLKLVHLVLAEKKDDICDCAEMLIKGGNIYHRDKASQTFHHDLCLLFPRQLESGDIDLQGLFNPNIPSREFDDSDVIRLYFISKRSDTKDAHLIDYCEVPISKFNEVQKSIKLSFSILRNKVEAMNQPTQAYASHERSVQFYEECSSGEIASTSKQPHLKTYQLEDSVDSLLSAVCPPQVEIAEYQRFLSPPRADSESEDSTTVYSLEECLIYAGEHMTDDSLSPPLPNSLGVSDIKSIRNKSGECSSEIGYLRQFTPSPRPVDLTCYHKSVDHKGSVTLSPSQQRDNESEIYYHLGDFTTQIQKGVVVDQLVAPPRPLQIKDNSSASVCQPGPSFNQKLLSPLTSLRMMSPISTDRNDKQLHGQAYQRSLSPSLEDKNEEDIRQSVQSQEYTSSQRVIPPGLIEDILRHGHPADSIHTSLQDVGIRCQENIPVDCTSCNLAKSMEIYRHVLVLEENIKQTLCAHHSAFYKERLAEYERILSQEDLSPRKSFSSFSQGYTHDQKDVSSRHTKSGPRQRSYPPFQRTLAYDQHTWFWDELSSGPSVHSQKYSLDAVASPTRVQKGLRKYVYSSDTSFEQGRFTNQRTLSHGDLTKKQSLSLHSQEYTSGERVFQRHAEQLKGVYIPGKQRKRDDQRIDSQENLTTHDRTGQSYLEPEKSLRDQEVSPRHTESRFRQRLHSDDSQSDQPKASFRRNSAEDECPHLWQSWREGPAPF